MLTLRKKPILRVIVIPTIVLTEIANAYSALITLLLFEGKTQRTNKLIIVRAESHLVALHRISLRCEIIPQKIFDKLLNDFIVNCTIYIYIYKGNPL